MFFEEKISDFLLEFEVRDFCRDFKIEIQVLENVTQSYIDKRQNKVEKCRV